MFREESEKIDFSYLGGRKLIVLRSEKRWGGTGEKSVNFGPNRVHYLWTQIPKCFYWLRRGIH